MSGFCGVAIARYGAKRARAASLQTVKPQSIAIMWRAPEVGLFQGKLFIDVVNCQR
jgi:hypothetical protein